MIPENIDSIDGLELAEVPTQEEKQLLISLVYTSTLSEQQREEKILEINNCLSYTLYAAMQYQLENIQIPFDQYTGYHNQKHINEHLRKIIK